MIFYTYGIALTFLFYGMNCRMYDYSDVKGVILVSLIWPVFALGIAAILAVALYLFVCDVLRGKACGH